MKFIPGFYNVPSINGGTYLATAEDVVNRAPYGAVNKALALYREGYGEEGVCFETGLRLFEARAIAEYFGV